MRVNTYFAKITILLHFSKIFNILSILYPKQQKFTILHCKTSGRHCQNIGCISHLYS